MINDLTLQKLHDLTRSELYDTEYGDFLYETVETRDTLDDFKSNCVKWAECDNYFSGSLGEFSYIGWVNVQSRKGEMRNPITIIDLGEVRISFRADIRDLL